MKKNEKIMIGILFLILLVMIGTLVIDKTEIWHKTSSITKQISTDRY